MINCPALHEIVNGTIGYSSLVKIDCYNYETVATYECDIGYVITSGDTGRTCTGNVSSSSGQWSGTAPQCPRMYLL